MTKRKFTPPTEFPTEYTTKQGRRAVILGRAPVGNYPLIGYVLHTEGEPSWPDCSTPEGWTEDGQHRTDWQSSDDLHDIPKRLTTWHNVYEDWVGAWRSTRREADGQCNRKQERLCVYRIERNEDGSNPEIFVKEV